MSMRPRVGWKAFLADLKSEAAEDNVSNGAAALAYYLLLSIFPMMIALLSVLPYLGIANLDTAIMDLLRQAIPDDAATMFSDTVRQITRERQGGLLSFGLLFTLWAASNGLYAIMQQLNITYDVKETRPFWKVRGTALLLTAMFGVLVVGAFALVVFGGVIQDLLTSKLGVEGPFRILFATLRWVIIAAALSLGFALTYYLGPDVDHRFRWLSPGSIFGTSALAVASLAFRIYVENFGSYSATYGGIGAVIVLMLWLYIAGFVVLLGSEINALLEHFSGERKPKGQKRAA